MHLWSHSLDWKRIDTKNLSGCIIYIIAQNYTTEVTTTDLQLSAFKMWKDRDYMEQENSEVPQCARERQLPCCATQARCDVHEATAPAIERHNQGTLWPMDEMSLFWGVRLCHHDHFDHGYVPLIFVALRSVKCRFTGWMGMTMQVLQSCPLLSWQMCPPASQGSYPIIPQRMASGIFSDCE